MIWLKPLYGNLNLESTPKNLISSYQIIELDGVNSLGISEYGRIGQYCATNDQKYFDVKIQNLGVQIYYLTNSLEDDEGNLILSCLNREVSKRINHQYDLNIKNRVTDFAEEYVSLLIKKSIKKDERELYKAKSIKLKQDITAAINKAIDKDDSTKFRPRFSIEKKTSYTIAIPKINSNDWLSIVASNIIASFFCIIILLHLNRRFIMQIFYKYMFVNADKECDLHARS